MSNFTSQMLSDGKGGADEQALISLASAVVFLGLEIFTVVVRNQAFDPLSFGAGIGALLGATSAGFGLRAHLTPDNGASPDTMNGTVLEHRT